MNYKFLAMFLLYIIINSVNGTSLFKASLERRDINNETSRTLSDTVWHKTIKSQAAVFKLNVYSVCSKWPPFAWTQARKRVRHWRTALSMTRWSSSSHAVKMRCRNSSTSRILCLYTFSSMADQILSSTGFKLGLFGGHKVGGWSPFCAFWRDVNNDVADYKVRGAQWELVLCSFCVEFS